MTATPVTHDLLSRLPAVRGKLRAGVELSKTNWFRVGGEAEVLFRPADEADLAYFLKEKPADVAVTVLGVGSNLIVRDGGLDGVVIRLGGVFVDMKVDGELLHCGAGALDLNVAQLAQQHGLAGLEFLSGIPGTIGGALRMNAGAYGREIKDVLVEARAMDAEGNVHNLKPADMDFAYRRTHGVPEGWIFLGCTLQGKAGDKDAIAAEMQRISDARGETQPIKSRTGGSTFKNPEGHKAWQLVDEAGCRGLTIGGAQMSELHCNFMINTGDATARDLEALGEEVRRRVKEKSGMELEWEIRRIGKEA
jgi:UDP-N-acetylmuramate dehydrogenase